MQVSEEDIQAKCRSDKPNFNHKKYLRSKFEEAMMIEALEPNVPSVEPNKLEKVKPATMQPPLPPNPPLPESPPMIMNVKQEIEDDEYNCGIPATELKKPGEIKADEDNPLEDKPTVTMCRNFARGTCKKGAACIFAHELIVSQLPGVYTFCRNFQNSICSFPKCKFVHATVFEKEHFYRTGYLPPHSIAHLKESAAGAPPPPPQPEEVPAELQPTVYCNVPPPPPPMQCMQPMAVGYNTEPVMELGDPNMFRMQPDPNIPVQNREWSELDQVVCLTVDPDTGEPLPKKCKNCTTNDLGERLLDAQLEQARRRKHERLEMIAQVDKKIKLISSVLSTVLNSNTPDHPQELQLPLDTDMNLMGEPSNNQLMSMLAKMLMNMESGLPPDAPYSG